MNANNCFRCGGVHGAGLCKGRKPEVVSRQKMCEEVKQASVLLACSVCQREMIISAPTCGITPTEAKTGMSCLCGNSNLTPINNSNAQQPDNAPSDGLREKIERHLKQPREAIPADTEATLIEAGQLLVECLSSLPPTGSVVIPRVDATEAIAIIGNYADSTMPEETFSPEQSREQAISLGNRIQQALDTNE